MRLSRLLVVPGAHQNSLCQIIASYGRHKSLQQADLGSRLKGRLSWQAVVPEFLVQGEALAVSVHEATCHANALPGQAPYDAAHRLEQSRTAWQYPPCTVFVSCGHVFHSCVQPRALDSLPPSSSGGRASLS
jgi:hypothetical protein